MSEIKNVRNCCARNLKASKTFRDLIVLLKYLSKPISLFLDENICFSAGDFARSSIKCDVTRNSLKRGRKKNNFFQ